MAPLSEIERCDFWGICEDRYQTRSLVLTSQLPVTRWHEQIGDPMVADGILPDRLLCDPRSGHIFLFSNAQRNRPKLLFWDRSGLWVCAKRLERGRLRWPVVEREQQKVMLTAEELALLLGGIDLSRAERRRWHRVLVNAKEDLHINNSQ